MSHNSIIVSAPGKVILHGEHAVVYGKVAIAAAIGLRTTVRLQQTKEPFITLQLQDLNTYCKWEEDKLENSLPVSSGSENQPLASTLERFTTSNHFKGLVEHEIPDAAKLAVKVFLFLLAGIGSPNGRLPRISVDVSSSLPTGAGLGSSAAYGVTLSAALLINKGAVVLSTQAFSTCETPAELGLPTADCKLISDWAFEAEKMIHGRPSGIDNSISVYGGALTFAGGSVNHLNCVPSLQVLVINTKVPRSTKAMVAALRSRYEKMPSIYDSIFDSIGSISEECTNTLGTLCRCQHSGDQALETSVCECFDRLETLVSINQNLLRALGVSHESLDTVCRVSSKHGLHSKLTGAGGGGCAVTLLRHDTTQKTRQVLQDELKELGFDVMEATLGSEGVRVETSWR